MLGTTIMICLRATLRSLGMFVNYTVTCLRAKTHVSTSRLAREKFTKVEPKIRDSIQKNDQTHHGAISKLSEFYYDSEIFKFFIIDPIKEKATAVTTPTCCCF